jgi:hypothetical protein
MHELVKEEFKKIGLERSFDCETMLAEWINQVPESTRFNVVGSPTLLTFKVKTKSGLQVQHTVPYSNDNGPTTFLQCCLAVDFDEQSKGVSLRIGIDSADVFYTIPIHNLVSVATNESVIDKSTEAINTSLALTHSMGI